MPKGIAIVTGSATVVHRLLESGLASFSGSVEVTGNVTPNADALREFGSTDLRWNDVYAVQTTVGAIFETGLTTRGIGKYSTGTVLVWKNGGLSPCMKEEDPAVMGVVKAGKEQPIIMGAEPVLVTGLVKEGDYLVTSNIPGHAKSAKSRKWIFFRRNLLGKVIGQALEGNATGEKTIKAMIHRM
jgi:hypothetical protein